MNKNINLLKNILFFGALVLLLELCLKLFAPVYFTGPLNAYEYNEDLGVAVKKNLNLVKITDVRQEYITNDLGTFNFENDFSIYDKIIFAAGDSFTQGTGVTPTSSYPFNLYINLNTNENVDISYGILNLGLAAYGFDQSFLTIKKFTKIIKPDIIIFLGVQNDERDDMLFNSGYRHKHLVDGSPRFFGFASLIGSISNNFEILKRMKLIYSTLKLKNLDTNEKIKINKDLNFDKYNKLKKFSELNQVKLYISWYQCHTQRERENYNNLKKWSYENNVEFVDWCTDFDKILKLNPNIPIANNHSSGHHRPWVYKIMAKKISERILND